MNVDNPLLHRRCWQCSRLVLLSQNAIYTESTRFRFTVCRLAPPLQSPLPKLLKATAQQQLPSAVPGNAVPTVHHLAIRFGPAAESFPPPTSDFWLPLNFLGYDAFPFIIVVHSWLVSSFLPSPPLRMHVFFTGPAPKPWLLLVDAPANHFTPAQPRPSHL